MVVAILEWVEGNLAEIVQNVMQLIFQLPYLRVDGMFPFGRSTAPGGGPPSVVADLHLKKKFSPL